MKREGNNKKKMYWERRKVNMQLLRQLHVVCVVCGFKSLLV